MTYNETRLQWLWQAHWIARCAAAACLAIASSILPAGADDYDDCKAGYERYNAHIKTLDSIELKGEFGSSEFDESYRKRKAVCTIIAPEVGYASCEAFIKSGYGKPDQRIWANEVASALAALYTECEAQ